MVKPSSCILIAALLSGCATPARPQSHLSVAQVIRIADTELGGPAGISRGFYRTKPTYSLEKGLWFVDYREKKTGYLKYNIEIDDSTGKATTTINDYR
jgi:hypothetical protein